MNTRETFDDALNAAIDALAGGRGLHETLAQHQRHADALLPLLQAAAAANAHASVISPPMSRRLAGNYPIVRAAVERAQIAADGEPGAARAAASNARWWQRRITVASLTVPLGAIVLFAGIGVGGAAAAGVATGSDGPLSSVSQIRERVADSVGSVNPFNGSASDKNAAEDVRATRADAAQVSTKTAIASPQAGAGTNAATQAPAGADATETRTRGEEGADGRVPGTITGQIRDVHGNTFKLADGATEWHVTIDGNTRVDGTIAEGASASVSGPIAADKNVQASTVVVVSATLVATPSPAEGKTPVATVTERGNKGRSEHDASGDAPSKDDPAPATTVPSP